RVHGLDHLRIDRPLLRRRPTVPTQYWPVRLPPWPVYMPGVDVDDVHPVLFAQSARNVRRDCVAYQRPDRRPGGNYTEPLPSNLIDDCGPIVAIAIDVGRWCVRDEHRVVRLDRGQSRGRRFQDCWMAYE